VNRPPSVVSARDHRLYVGGRFNFDLRLALSQNLRGAKRAGGDSVAGV